MQFFNQEPDISKLLVQVIVFYRKGDDGSAPKWFRFHKLHQLATDDAQHFHFMDGLAFHVIDNLGNESVLKNILGTGAIHVVVALHEECDVLIVFDRFFQSHDAFLAADVDSDFVVR